MVYQTQKLNSILFLWKYKIGILFFLSFCLTFTSCEEEPSLEGWYQIIPLDDFYKKHSIWKTQKETICFFNNGILEIIGGISTPFRYYSKSTPFYIKNNKISIYSPPLTKWIKYDIKATDKNFFLTENGKKKYVLTKVKSPKKNTFLPIKEIELVINDDSSSFTQPKKLTFNYKFESLVFNLKIDFYINKEFNIEIKGNLYKNDIFLIEELVSRVNDFSDTSFESNISNTSVINIIFNDGTKRSYIKDNSEHSTIYIEDLIKFLSNYHRYKPVLNYE